MSKFNNASTGRSSTKNSSEEKLTLKRIADMANSTVDTSLQSMLKDLGYKIQIVIGDNENVSVNVVNQINKPISSLDELRSLMGFKRILAKDLEDRGKGSSKTLVELMIALHERKTGTIDKLTSIQTKRLTALNPWLVGFKALLKLLDDSVGDMRGLDRFNRGFLNLVIGYGDALEELLASFRNARANSNATEELMELLKMRGVPKWFHKNVILKLNDFKLRIGSENSYRLFFSPTGTSTITLTSEELLSAEFVRRLIRRIGSVYSSASVLESLVKAIDDKDVGLDSGGFVPDTYVEKDIFFSFNWFIPLNLEEDEVESYFDVKSRDKVCPTVPQGTYRYSDRLTRLNIAMVRSYNMEAPDVDSMCNVFAEIFNDSTNQLFVSGKQANVYELAKRTTGYKLAFSEYTKMSSLRNYDILARVITMSMATPAMTLKRGSVFAFLEKLKTEKHQLLSHDSETYNLIVGLNDGAPFQEQFQNLTTTPPSAKVTDMVTFCDEASSFTVGPPKFLLECARGEFLSMRIRNYIYGELTLNPSWSSKGIQAFVTNGKFSVPTNRSEIEDLEKDAARLNMNPEAEEAGEKVQRYVAHDNVAMMIRKGKLNSVLDRRLFKKVTQFIVSYRQEEKQMYVANVVLATYNDFVFGTFDTKTNFAEEVDPFAG